MIKILRYIKPYRVSIALVFGLVFLQALSDLYLPTIMADIVNNGIVRGDTSYIWVMGGFMLLVAIGGAACSISTSFFSSRISAGFGRIIRGKLFTHVENFSLHEFDTIGTASMITRTTNDTNQVQQILIILLRMMIYAPLMCIGGVIMAVSQDATLAWVVIIAIPVISLVIFLIMWQAIPLFKILQVKLDKLNLIINEGLTGVRVIRAFDRIKYEQQHFDKANLDLTSTAVKVNRTTVIMMPAMMLILNFATIGIIWFGGLRINSGEMQIGSLIAFLQYAMQILFALMMLSMMFVMLPRASASAVRINAVLDIEPEIKDAENTHAVEAKSGYVEFQDVTFSYPGAAEPALCGISFQAQPGEVTAIIGGTGSGKSTLVSLIPRFYDVVGGKVLVDGVDVREMAQSQLRAKLGFVPQRAVLFTGTIAENIRFGKADATIEEISHAATVAQASDFIAEMPLGFDSVLAQGGTNVSGGQKQRLSIARALVRKPEIYIFDDTFSALDFKTDARLRAALKQETVTSTVLIVAQRVSTVMDADRIIVLDDGTVAGIGNHSELMQTCEVYREIVASQLALELEEVEVA
jgi:ATP-binding cassette subfamily B protein